MPVYAVRWRWRWEQGEMPKLVHSLPEYVQATESGVIAQNTPFGRNAWCLEEDEFNPQHVAQRESIFTLGNGQLGIRGQFEEDYPQAVEGAINGTYWNGLYVRRPIEYGESAPGFPEQMDYMPSILCGRGLLIELDGQTLRHLTVLKHHRKLDFSTGLSQRKTLWGLQGAEAGNVPWLTVEVETLVSFVRPGLLAQRIRLSAERDCQCRLVIPLRPSAGIEMAEDDPRISSGAQEQLLWESAWVNAERAQFGACQRAVNGVISAAVQLNFHNQKIAPKAWQEAHAVGLETQLELKQGESLSFERLIQYQWQPISGADQAASSNNGSHPEGKGHLEVPGGDNQWPAFDALAREQEQNWQAFWQQASIEIFKQPVLEQALRFSAFQLRQSCSRSPDANIAAKGLSGPGYEGHYFWDSEIYVLPYFSLVEPDTAKALLGYRIKTLPKARQRAQQLSHLSGALYPWRTISGDECSAYFPAGTAQYHINADIAYAVKRYLLDSGDWDFVLNEAAEMLLETAKIWLDLGHFNRQQDGRFTIHEVTGPDEYTALVDNNYYTNLMAAEHLRFAACVGQRLAQKQPRRWAQLRATLGIGGLDLERWRQAAELMHMPQDSDKDISWQDDRFSQRPPWDSERYPLTDTPLLLKHHPLVLYRHQILKQADVLMAHFLCPAHSDLQRKLNDFQFYEPLTTHDSSLSACVHSIVASWTGQTDKALDYFWQTARSDLDDLHGNSGHGLHIAAMAGSLACIYQGFAGIHLRHAEGVVDEEGQIGVEQLNIQPQLPLGWDGYRVHFRHRDCLLELSLRREQTEQNLVLQLSLKSGSGIQLFIHGQQVALTAQAPLFEMIGP